MYMVNTYIIKVFVSFVAAVKLFAKIPNAVQVVVPFPLPGE